MKPNILYVKKQYLLLVAGLVWGMAGFNIVRIGVLASDRSWSLLMLVSAIFTFIIFFLFIFKRLITKHTKRILGHEVIYMNIFQFFDRKSYLIMAFMMSFGILLRASQLWPDVCIKTFYSGLGLSLCMAGLGFLYQFIKACKQIN